MQATMEQLTAEKESAIEANRRRGVVSYQNGEKQSDKVFEVTDGKKYLPGPDGEMQVLGPGSLFHPTERQVRNGSLKGKAREVSASVYEGLGRQSFTGADIGLRQLPMAHGTLKAALAAGLTEADFEDIAPAGSGGVYTRAQVEDLIALKTGN